jgi:hypothetical protein
MDKRILFFGSVLAAIMFIMVSFNSVVGFQTNSISSSEVSPLYTIRTKNAIEDENRDPLIYDYFGKGKTNTIQLPPRNKNNTLLKKTIEIICKMNDKTFNLFLSNVIKKMQDDRNINSEMIFQVRTLFHYLRDHEQEVRNFIINDKAEDEPTLAGYTVCVWFPGCSFIRAVIYIINFILGVTISIILLLCIFVSVMDGFFSCSQ